MNAKERFLEIYSLSRIYQRDELRCPPTLPFVAWCGRYGAEPNIFRCQLSFVTKAKEVAWNKFKSEKYYPGWLQDKREEYEYRKVSGKRRVIPKKLVFMEEN